LAPLGEVLREQIGLDRQAVVGVRRVPKTTPDTRPDAVSPHQTRYTVLADFMATIAELVDHTRAAVPSFVLGLDGTNLREQAVVGHLVPRPLARRPA
jgi:hypothetical protein